MGIARAMLRSSGRSRAGGKRFRLRLEALENRYALTGFCDLGTCVSIEMLPEFDTFGNQIETVQAFGEGDDALVGFAIYDTGASVITWAANDQTLFQLLSPTGEGIPIKVPGGASADAIGGVLIGDVSEPGVIRADGLHVLDFLGGFEFAIEFENPGRAEGVQSFIGTTNGSPQLPTITGVPIHFPSPDHTSGVAARIDMNAFEYDLGAMFPEFGELFENLVLYAPDIHFVDSGEVLAPSPDGDTTAPIRIPLSLLGADNHANPGDEITYVHNPVQSNVFLSQDGVEVADQTLLFDTGAQLSVISTEIALGLGLNLDNPQITIDVQGAAGQAEIPGYYIDELQVPIDNDGDGVFDGGLQFTNVAIFVLDLIPELDGILGMNLFNTADVVLYDPFDPLGPSVQTRFFNDLVRESYTLEEDDGLGDLEIDLLAASFPTLAGSLPSGARTLANLGLGNPVSKSEVVGRHLFFNDSALDGFDPAANAADDAARATQLLPLFPGQPAAARNITGMAEGITGVMIDVANLADPAGVSAADFEFRFGNTADPGQWNAAPAPQEIAVRAGAGSSGSDRVSLTWQAGDLRGGWLEVRLKASPATGLEFDDVFYFGNQAGDANGDGEVNASDFQMVRNNPRNFMNPATADDPFDLNHDGNVNSADMLIVRDSTTQLSDRLPLFTPPPADLGPGMVVTLSRATDAAPARSLVSRQAAPPPEADRPSAARSERIGQTAIRQSSGFEPLAEPPAVEAVDRLMACLALQPQAERTDWFASSGGSSAEELPLEPGPLLEPF